MQDQDNTPSSPFGRGWIPGERDIGLPEDAPGAGLPPLPPSRALARSAPEQAAAPHHAFTPERRARFLALLAERGNVRHAAAAAGISAQSAYLARRRDALFAAGWEAALVEARHHVEQVLADRALDGVEEPVYYHGELIALRRRFDTRLLLAHLSRLDARAGRAGAAVGHAERFDEVLALVAGEAVPAGLAASMGAARAGKEAGTRGGAGDPLLPPERAAHVARATAGLGPGAYARARDRAGAEWDAWADAARARADALVEPHRRDSQPLPAGGPAEFKSLQRPEGVAPGEMDPGEAVPAGEDICPRTVSTVSTGPQAAWPDAGRVVQGDGGCGRQNGAGIAAGPMLACRPSRCDGLLPCSGFRLEQRDRAASGLFRAVRPGNRKSLPPDRSADRAGGCRTRNGPVAVMPGEHPDGLAPGYCAS